MADLANLTVRLTPAGFDQVTGEAGRVESAFGKMSAGIITANQALGLLQQGLAVVDRFLGEAVRAAAEQERALAALNAQLQIQGRYSYEYSQALQDQASALQQVTIFADETINSAQALLATFPKLGNDVLPRATEAALDLATALGTDLQSAAQTLGIALNDPAEGLQRLSRLGVRFTDEQKNLIQSLIDAGDAAGAQGYVLDELAARMGGRATAAAQTYEGGLARLGNAFGELLEEIGNFAVKSEFVRDGMDNLRASIDQAAAATREYREANQQQIDQDLAGWYELVTDYAAGLDKVLRPLNINVEIHTSVWGKLIEVLGGVGSAYANVKRQIQEEGFGFFTGNISETNRRIEEANQRGDLGAAVRAWRESLEQFSGQRVRRPTDTLAGPPEEFPPGEFTPAAGGNTTPASAFGGEPGTTLPPGYRYRRETGSGFYDYSREDIGPFRPGDAGFQAWEDRGGARARAVADGLREEAQALRETLDPLARYQQAVEDLKALEPFLSPEEEAAALQQIGQEFEQSDALLQTYRRHLIELKGEAAQLYEETRTPYERLVQQLSRLRELSERGLLAEHPEVLPRAIANARKEFDALNRDGTDALGNLSEVAESFSRGVGDAFVQMRRTGRVEFQDLLEGLADDITRFLAAKTITEPLLRWINEAIDDARSAFSGQDQQFAAAMREAGVDQQGASPAAAPTTKPGEAMEQAAAATQDGFEAMIAVVENQFLSMITGVGGALLALFGGLFGGGGGFSGLGFLKAVGFGFAGGALRGLGNWSGGTTAVEGPGGASWDVEGGGSTWDQWASGNAVRVREGDRAMAQTQSPTIINVPVTIPVTSLDDRNAAAVIMRNMPLIHSEIVRGINRGGSLARAVNRRS